MDWRIMAQGAIVDLEAALSDEEINTLGHLNDALRLVEDAIAMREREK